jgi:hypothetical protein
VSYTELEHRTAADLGIPTLVFVLADDAQGPAVMFRDTEHEPGRTRSVAPGQQRGHYGADHHPPATDNPVLQARHERCRGCFAHSWLSDALDPIRIRRMP